MNFRWSRVLAMAKKEVFHVVRDPFTLSLSIGLPAFLVFAFGYAIEFNTKYIPLGVHDDDKTQSSRRLIETFGASQYFISTQLPTPAAAQDALAMEKNRGALIIPAGFEEDLFAGRTGQAQLLLDGSDNSTVSPILNYVNAIENLAATRLVNFEPPQVLNLKTRYLFNPELNSRWFVIPGLTVVVMAILSILLTALTVAREWENGSMELLLSTPVKPVEIIIGKLAPYGIMGLLAVLLVYVISRTVFHVPFQGNFAVFMLGCVLFITTYLAQGLVISVVTRKQELAMQFAMMTGMVPSQLLSGFIFPIESMPKFFHYFTMLFPARWFMVVARQSYLKGSTFMEMSAAFAALTTLCCISIAIATRRFKRDLEP